MANLINVPIYTDERGYLGVIDQCLPFKIKRVFFIKNVPHGMKRGEHKHIKTRLAIIVIEGVCKVYCNNGSDEYEFELKSASECLILEARDWHVLYEFSNNCVVLVLASEDYDPEDYIYEPYD